MVLEVAQDSQFQTELTNAGSKLVVVDFFATWCGPCRHIAPVFEQFSEKYNDAVFLKVDVDKCPETAASAGVSAMPTFVFYRNKTKLDSQRGADANALEDKIKKWYGGESEAEETVVKGHMDLSAMISSAGCECMNESDDHPLAHALTSKGGYLESDCDEQLIIAIAFNQNVKLHSLKIVAPGDKGPKNIKVFINQPHTLDFDSAESMAPMQSFELTADDIQENSLIPLRFVKYQNVQNLTAGIFQENKVNTGATDALAPCHHAIRSHVIDCRIDRYSVHKDFCYQDTIPIFVKDNQGGTETTQIDHLAIYGSPLSVTNMSDFKRVAGKKGESE